MKRFLSITSVVCTLLMAFSLSSVSSAQTRTGWEMHSGEGIVEWGSDSGQNGAIMEYDFATIPVETDAGWVPAPDSEIIAYIQSRSTLCGVTSCRYGADFTYFQTFVNVPSNVVVTEFTISFSGVNDGVRVMIFNSDYLTGLVVPGGYVFSEGTGTAELSALVKSGEANRVVVTHTDDCCEESYLHSAVVVLNGEIVEGPVDVCVPGICNDGNPCTIDSCSVDPNNEPLCHFSPGNNGALCRASSDVCDAADVCVNGGCPDRAQPRGTVCNTGSGDLCDPDEVCSGASGSCPPDHFEPATTACNGDQVFCSGVPDVSCPAPVDTDGDGVPDSSDLCPGTAPLAQVDTFGCSPDQYDSDGDGVSDNEDNCLNDPNPDQADLDDDGTGDICDDDADGDDESPPLDCNDFDPSIFTGAPEICSDGIDNDCDALIDGADPESDCDGDLVPNNSDNCPDDPNPGQSDIDGDGFGDVCDDDDDNDGFADEEDNCPTVANDQADFDLDGIGDACESDDDGDGVDDIDDLCGFTAASDLDAGVPNRGLGKNRWVDIDGDGMFDTSGKNPTGRNFTIDDTAGCNCAQIIDACGYGEGHSKFGCSISAMDWWTGLYERDGQSPYQCEN